MGSLGVGGLAAVPYGLLGADLDLLTRHQTTRTVFLESHARLRSLRGPASALRRSTANKSYELSEARPQGRRRRLASAEPPPGFTCLHVPARIPSNPMHSESAVASCIWGKEARHR